MLERREPPRLTLELRRPQLPALSGLLQRGVAVPAETGCSVLRLLTHQLGVDPDYVAARVTTVFLDGKVVDELDRSVVGDGSLLALSAAMPGLVGATLRRGGAYAAMRAEITDRAGGAPVAAREGVVRVKLFNMLIAELGPVLLRHGILLEHREAAEALAGLADLSHLRPGERVFVRGEVIEERP